MRRPLPMMRDDGGDRLGRALAARVRGEVRFDAGSRALYATDASNYRHVPIGVVVPRDADDVVATVATCRELGAPVLSRGGGTSLAGQTANAAVVMDFSKRMNRIVSLDPERRRAVVEPGLVLDVLRDAAEEHGLTFGPDPATHTRCTLGGMIGNSSCGVHSIMAGSTAANVERLEVLTYDGARFTVGATSDEQLRAILARGGREAEIHRRLQELIARHAGAIRAVYPGIPRRVSGYNLPALLPENGFHVAQSLVGSEGTLVTVLRAEVRLVPSPRHRVLLVLGYPDVYRAADHIEEILEGGPIGVEGVDQVLTEAIARKGVHGEGLDVLPEGGGWLLAEIGGDSRDEAIERTRRLMARLERAACPPAMKLVDDPDTVHRVWQVRESGLGATARVPGKPDTWEGWEDASVPPARLGSYLRAFRSLLDGYGFEAALYGHFGQGCVHTRIPFDLRSTEGIATYRRFVEQAADLVVRHDGSLSGEHGDGQSRAELLPRMFGPELMRAFEEMKDIWDPTNHMNPGKVVWARRLDDDLRLGAAYRRPDVATHFRFPDDDGSFAYATERCVGVGECRRLDGGTMCPSYMVTLEEAHSTRGRAHLLFEAMRGGLPEGMKSDAVRDALDLCLACKGCKSECPVNVDVATYKAEFLSHYYEGRLRPRSAYVFGLIDVWARLGALAPGLANTVMRQPTLARIIKAIAGIAPERELPQIAPVTFSAWWRARRVPEPAGSPAPGRTIVLWVDTFNEHWQPAVLAAAVEVLEAAGYRVTIPRRRLCCGRPLYDYGMLPRAKRLLREVLDTLRPAIRAGTPVVGLEPSCVATLRDELVALFPDDEDAHRLKEQTLTLDELLRRDHDDVWKAPRLDRDAIVQGHCHQKAVLGMGDHAAILERLGVRAEVLDAGCCGLAGGFGYESGHLDVSVACGERRLLPAVRDASPGTVIVADGFSCREQIRQLTDRQALHLAQVIRLAMRGSAEGREGEPPERGQLELQMTGPHRRAAVLARTGRLAAVVGLTAAGLAALVALTVAISVWVGA